jgi:hypothetical protein
VLIEMTPLLWKHNGKRGKLYENTMGQLISRDPPQAGEIQMAQTSTA